MKIMTLIRAAQIARIRAQTLNKSATHYTLAGAPYASRMHKALAKRDRYLAIADRCEARYEEKIKRLEDK